MTLELRLICTTANDFRDDYYKLDVLLVNTGSKSIKLEPPYILEIFIPGEIPIVHDNTYRNHLIAPEASLSLYYHPPIQLFSSDAEIILKFNYHDEKPLEVKRSIKQLLEEAIRLQGEKRRSY